MGVWKLQLSFYSYLPAVPTNNGRSSAAAQKDCWFGWGARTDAIPLSPPSPMSTSVR